LTSQEPGRENHMDELQWIVRMSLGLAAFEVIGFSALLLLALNGDSRRPLSSGERWLAQTSFCLLLIAGGWLWVMA
jgi:hypothetical protein